MSEIKIDKNIPIPAPGAGRHPKYPLGEMEVGDSFFTVTTRDKIAPAVSWFGRRNGKKFSVRKEDDGFRIWRVV